MVLNKKIFLLSLLLMMLSGIASAEVRIGFVNLQKVGNEAPQAVKAMKKLKSEFEKREADLQKLGKTLQTMQERLEKDGVTMSEADRRVKEREFADLNRDFQRKQREIREDWSLRQNEELMLLNESVTKVIKRIAETEKYDLIVQEAVYFSNAIDITPKVIKALGDGGTSTAPAGTGLAK